MMDVGPALSRVAIRFCGPEPTRPSNLSLKVYRSFVLLGYFPTGLKMHRNQNLDHAFLLERLLASLRGSSLAFVCSPSARRLLGMDRTVGCGLVSVASFMGYLDLQGVFQVLVNLHDGCLVTASIAVVGCAEYGDHVSVLTPVVAFHD